MRTEPKIIILENIMFLNISYVYRKLLIVRFSKFKENDSICSNYDFLSHNKNYRNVSLAN